MARRPINRNRLALVGWAVSVLLVPILVDWRAIVAKKETMSRLYARGLLHPIAGPVVLGASAALAWHLTLTVLSELIERLERMFLNR